ncbi:hypothetical protein BbINS_00860 [Bartonella bacilliformis INS]|uniref:Uncharacterized protein n=2 Tax=Bartonella bacilliformis TaxID=774 RepID=A1URB4_BARBK|nr:hypothetical protein BARBAKC583_0179 [Bartonella bacilliformis KC583]EKS46068.1 hypothetical protein BbINS_00860 [Bartonella bacilliformis INS]
MLCVRGQRRVRGNMKWAILRGREDVGGSMPKGKKMVA